jgi:hypothetical protein
MDKSITYTESKELKQIAEQLKARYINVVGYVDLDKIFFAFKGGDLSEFFKYEVVGLQSEWVKYTNPTLEEVKTYCIAMTFDFYQKSSGPLLEWIMLEALYSCIDKMNGKLRKKDIHEYSRLVTTLDDLGCSLNWRENYHLPSLLGEETIIFGVEDESL